MSRVHHLHSKPFFWMNAYKQMAQCARDLHKWADETVNELEGHPILEADTAEGDEARAALHNARAWRAVIEGGVE